MGDGHRADIDGLRALAVGMVVLFHAGVPGFSGGYAGVDVFFVLSGFLITGLLVRSLDRGDLSLRRFYERRIRRLLPAAFVMSVATLLAAIVIQPPVYLASTAKTFGAAQIYGANIHLWRSLDYFAPGAETQPLLHTWSLSVEEQFYLVVPALLLVLHRSGATATRAALWAVTLGSFALAAVVTPRSPTAAFYLLPTRGWELALGGLLAVGALPPPPPAARQILGALGLLALAGTTVLYDPQTPFPSWPALVPCLATVVLLQARGAVGEVLSHPSLRWLGLRSYSLYLWHWPLLVLAPQALLRDLQGWETALLLVLSAALAELSYRFVETPFRSPSATAYPGPRAYGAAAVSFLVGGLGAFALADGLPSRFPAFVTEHSYEEPYWKPRCFQGTTSRLEWRAEPCTTGAGPAVLFLGDSFGAHYIPGLATVAPPITLTQRHRSRCPPVPIDGTPHCAAFDALTLEVAGAAPYQHVVMAARWRWYRDQGVLEGLERRLDALVGEGHHVTVIGQSPLFEHDVVAMAIHQGLTDPDEVAWAPIGDLHAYNERVRAIVEAAGATYVDPLPAFCEADRCRYRADGVYLFDDIGHLSPVGSELAVRAYFPFVE